MLDFGIRSKKKEELSVVESVKVEKETGLEGDHLLRKFKSGKRQVTLIQQDTSQMRYSL